MRDNLTSIRMQMELDKQLSGNSIVNSVIPAMALQVNLKNPQVKRKKPRLILKNPQVKLLRHQNLPLNLILNPL